MKTVRMLFIFGCLGSLLLFQGCGKPKDTGVNQAYDAFSQAFGLNAELGIVFSKAFYANGGCFNGAAPVALNFAADSTQSTPNNLVFVKGLTNIGAQPLNNSKITLARGITFNGMATGTMTMLVNSFNGGFTQRLLKVAFCNPDRANTWNPMPGSLPSALINTSSANIHSVSIHGYDESFAPGTNGCVYSTISWPAQFDFTSVNLNTQYNNVNPWETLSFMLVPVSQPISGLCFGV